MKPTWVAVSGGKLNVQVQGDGHPLLLVHGWPLDHRMFAPQVGEISRFFTTISFDRRGFGRSTAPPDLRLELDDIERILDALNVQDAHLLGMSQGGRIALRFAATRPERLRSLLLQGAVIDGFRVQEAPDHRVPVAEYAELAGSGHLDEVRKRWLEHPMMRLGDEYPRETALLQRILADYTGADLLHFDADSYSFGADVLGAMAEFPKPALLLTGANETEARRRHAHELRRRIPDCDEVVFSKSQHLCNLTEPAAYNHAVIEFCRKVDATGSASAGGAFD